MMKGECMSREWQKRNIIQLSEGKYLQPYYEAAVFQREDTSNVRDWIGILNYQYLTLLRQENISWFICRNQI